MAGDDELSAIRQRIDALDDRLLELFNERARLAREVARLKQAAGERADCYRAEREAVILRRLVAANQGPLADESVARLYRELMSACLAVQKPLRVAYLGPPGTFTQEAAHKHFGHAIETDSLPTIGAVFGEVESGAVDYGVVPVENSTEGVVSHTLDCFLTSPLQIVGEVELRIRHALASRVAELAEVRRVYSHQQGLAQCRGWLDVHLPHAERHAVASTAEAARRAAEEEGAAAVASEAAAELYELPVRHAGIEDEAANTTRFLVIGTESPAPSGADKTSLVLSRTNRPGGLYRLLEPLARHGINMTRIESRPARQGTWEYVFFVDLVGHAEDDNVRPALEEIRAEASLFKVLGAYPQAVQ